jgi:hypothetical protein
MDCNELSTVMCDAVFQFTDFETFFGAELDPTILIGMRAQIRFSKY